MLLVLSCVRANTSLGKHKPWQAFIEIHDADPDHAVEYHFNTCFYAITCIPSAVLSDRCYFDMQCFWDIQCCLGFNAFMTYIAVITFRSL